MMADLAYGVLSRILDYQPDSPAVECEENLSADLDLWMTGNGVHTMWNVLFLSKVIEFLS